MKRRCLFYLFVSLLVFGSLGVLGQEVVRFGRYSVVPEQNVVRLRGGASTSGQRVLPVQPVEGRVNVLMQFKGSLDARALQRLSLAGVELDGYVGGNAYFATIRPGMRPVDFREYGALSVVPMRPEWKMSAQLEDGKIPTWAQRGDGRVAVTLGWFSNVDLEYVVSHCGARGWAAQGGQEKLRMVRVELPLAEVRGLASEPWVQYVGLIDPPKRSTNYNGAAMSGARAALAGSELGGRGLSGKGVRVGLWDGNVEPHVDYGDRVHVLEFDIPVELVGGHGLHTMGTVAGSGLLEPRARGVAPAAEVYTMNFNVTSNGKTAEEEMLELEEKYNISLTSNSYGVEMEDLCDIYEEMSYSMIPASMALDLVSYNFPNLTHVFSAGNSQGACDKAYGHMPERSKNVIYVGAVDELGNISDFSSFGPMDDGRLTPLVSAKGVEVLSTVGSNGYERMDGTSMACPMVSGMSALLTERYHQMHGGAHPSSALIKGLLANTADDRGPAGPDYQYGYGLVNLERALTTLEKGWYKEGSIQKGDADAVVTLDVPAGATRLRAMLTWIDPVVMKQYAYGERALVSDLDLTASQGGTKVLPWILDKDNPDSEAVRGVDSLNNVEQVTIDDLQAGKVELRVSGQAKLHDDEPQAYVLTWYFETDSPRLLHPLGGEKFGAGEEILVRAESLKGDCTVELSYDDGKSYANLGHFGEIFSQPVRIPVDAKATSKARLRVVDSEGNIVVSPGSFSISPIVHGLRYESSPCDLNSWQLMWDAAEGVTRYVVLRADVEQGTWSKVTSVEGTSYTLQETEITKGGRNVYAVAAELEGDSWGMRSKGVLVAEPTGLALTSEQLPFVEHFVELPSRYAKMEAGENMKCIFPETIEMFNMELGSHMMTVSVAKNADEGAELFKFDKNIFTVRHCSLDLTGVNTDEKVVFYALDWMTPAKVAEDAQLRLLVNGAPVKNVAGEDAYVATDNAREMLWDLSGYAGKSIRVEMQFACHSKGGQLFVFEYGVRKVTEKTDVGVYLRNSIASRPNLGVEEVEVGVINTSLAEVKKVPIAVRVDGEQVAVRLEESLKPFEVRMVKIPVDFSTSEREGKKFSVEVEVTVPGDENAANNVSRAEAYNMGDVVVFPPVTTVPLFGHEIPIDPHMVEIVKGERRFADDGGLLEGCGAGHMSSVRFMPSDPRKKLMITFDDQEMLSEEVLQVFTQDVGDFNLEMFEPEYSFTSSSEGGPAPKSFVSRSEDGSITVRFVSIDTEESGRGWDATVREVELGNTLTLLPLELEESYPTGEAYLKVRVQNNTPTAQQGVRGFVKMLGMEENVRFEIPEIAANELVEYELATPLPVPYPTSAQVTVTVSGADGDASDNTQVVLLQNDKYWVGGTIEDPNVQGIQKASIPPQSVDLSWANGEHHSYVVDERLAFYMGTLTPLFVELLNEPTSEELPASLHVWIDLDPTDRAFSDEGFEHYSLPLEAGKKEYRLDVDLREVMGLRAGDYRMRIGVFADADLETFRQKGTVSWGCSVDITAELHEGEDPVSTDVAIARIEEIASGCNLSSTQSVQVVVQNNGYTPLSGVEVELLVNGEVKAKEHCAQTIDPFGGECAYEIKQAVDLSAPGRYEITVRVAEDKVSENDEASLTVINVSPQREDKLYMLSFSRESGEGIVLPSLMVDATSSKVSMEGWFYLNQTQQKMLFGADGLLVFSTYKKSDGLPMNGIAVVLGASEMLAFSEPEALTPGVFHHVAVTFHKEELEFYDQTTVRVYIDGEEIPMESIGRSAPSYENLSVGVSLDGKVKMVRVWEKLLSADEVKTNMGVSLRDADGLLPEGCVAEYMMNESVGGYIASGADIAELRGERPDFPEAAWVEASQLIEGVALAGQILCQSVSRERIEILMPHDFDTNVGVKGMVKTLWPETEVRYEGAVVDENTEFEFSNADHTIRLQASKEIFGITTQHEIEVKVLLDKNPEAKITKLDVLTADNANLKADINEVDPSRTVVLALEDVAAGTPVDLTKVGVTFSELSRGAKVIYGEEEISEGGKLEFDLTRPVAVKVLAENERDYSYYTLQVAKPQSITWDASDLTLTFTKDVSQMNATSSSGMAVVYRSLDPSVAMVDGEGKLHTAGVGETTIEATVPAGGHYAAAEKVSRKVKVLPAPLTIKPVAIAIEEGDAIPPVELEFVGLLFDEFRGNFKQPEYEIYKNGTTLWKPGKEPLGVGTHTLKPSGGATTYTDGNYSVTLEDGTLEVKSSTKVKEVKFTVKDAADATVDGATVSINGFTLTTVGGGVASIRLLPGEYPYEVTKADYQTAEGTVVVKAEDVGESVILPKFAVTLTYVVAETEGAILGEKVQRLPKNGSGAPVTALAAAGYKFTKWKEDSKTTATRVDENLTANTTFTAQFEVAKYRLIYKVSEGGEIKSGSTSAGQLVPYGQDALEVEVEPKPGYVFYAWSDGVRTPIRQAKNVTADLSVEALFYKLFTLPLVENFEGAEGTPTGWYIENNSTNDGSPWRIARNPKFMELSNGRIVYVNSNGEGVGLEQNTYIQTPWISLDGVANDIIVAFDLLYENMMEHTDSVRVEYSLDGGAWKELQKYKMSVYNERQELTIANSELAGKQQLSVRWHYGAQWAQYVAIDNIVVSEAERDAAIIYEVAGNGKVKLESHSTPEERLVVNVPSGAVGESVYAVPDAGYEFDMWSDYKTDNPRQDAIAARYIAHFRPERKPLVTLSYDAEPYGRIDGMSYQTVETGSKGAPVYAVGDTPGVRFMGWSDGKNDNPRVDVATADGVKVTAKFALYCLVSVEAQGDGEVKVTLADGGSLPADGMVSEGTRIKIVATPRTGNAVASWEGVDALPSVKEVDVIVKAPVKVKVEFRKEVTLTVKVTSSGGPLEKAKVSVEGYPTVETESNGIATIKVATGRYAYEVSDEGFATVVGEVTLEADNEVVVRLVSGATAAFTVVAEGQPVEKACITIDGKKIFTDEAGKVSIALEKKEYDYTVATEGYVTHEGRISLAAGNAEEAVTLTPIYELTVKVAVKGAPLRGAKVVVGDLVEETDSEGKAFFSLAKGKHAYTISAEGYLTETGEADLSGGDVTVEKSLRCGLVLLLQEAGGGALEGAKVTVEGQPPITVAADGRASFKLDPGTYKYKVEKLGYRENSGYIVLLGSLQMTVELERRSFTLLFEVTANGAPVGQATIKIAGQANALTTSADGKASVKLPAGGYSYTVEKEKYETLSGSVDLAKDETVRVEMKSVEIPIKEDTENAVESVLLAGVQVLPNPFGAVLRLTGVEALRELQVYTVQGVPVYMGTHSGEATLLLQTENWSSGVYILRMVDARGATKQVRVVKQ